MATSQTNQPRRTLLLTGASRGIGHATVKRFSAAGWRVITCSRHPFPENCPWEAGPEDHIQVDLAGPEHTLRAISEVKQRLENGELHALVNNAAISPKADGGKRLSSIETLKLRERRAAPSRHDVYVVGRAVPTGLAEHARIDDDRPATQRLELGCHERNLRRLRVQCPDQQDPGLGRC